MLAPNMNQKGARQADQSAQHEVIAAQKIEDQPCQKRCKQRIKQIFLPRSGQQPCAALPPAARSVTQKRDKVIGRPAHRHRIPYHPDAQPGRQL